jgi:hypothetical protein
MVEVPFFKSAVQMGFRVVHPDGTVNLFYDSRLHDMDYWTLLVAEVWSRETIANQATLAGVEQDEEFGLLKARIGNYRASFPLSVGCATATLTPSDSQFLAYVGPGNIPDPEASATDALFGSVIAFNMALGPKTLVLKDLDGNEFDFGFSVAPGVVIQAELFQQLMRSCPAPVPDERDCAEETTLAAQPVARPAELNVVQDESNPVEIDYYRLDEAGNKNYVMRGFPGDSLVLLTREGTPWVLEDTAGRCLRILVPGPGGNRINLE